MLRLLVIILLALAAWQAKLNYRDLMTPRPMHEIVVENHFPVAVERVRVTLGGKTAVRERIEAGASTVLQLPANQGTKFRMVWLRSDRTTEADWSGGQPGSGPQRHTFTLQREASVLHSFTSLATGKGE